ncbi:L-threonylcarbamoyladenylate synthase [Halalkalirubrum salinum]|uniref:L-threonylcarbamoyladenylate synthase n=1 Tax=Halalkalirubrum salinum TaxID=2563889 RepID=UPI0010FAE6CB|nr:L-threonylcarbamoyladenylate synthase [Halalkalirubrum salinum]
MQPDDGSAPDERPQTAVPRHEIVAAAEAVAEGEAIVYPTETVYGLGADGSDADAVSRVYELKGRSADKPLSIAVPDIETAEHWAHLTDRDRSFMRLFLPGPVTVVVKRNSSLPPQLTGGGNRVGIRIPDHPVALSLLEETAPTPVTATSANRSGEPSIRNPEDLPAPIRAGVAAIVDAGTTPGGVGSTVVDIERATIHRRGAIADDVERWLAER